MRKLFYNFCAYAVNKLSKFDLVLYKNDATTKRKCGKAFLNSRDGLDFMEMLKFEGMKKYLPKEIRTCYRRTLNLQERYLII